MTIYSVNQNFRHLLTVHLNSGIGQLQSRESHLFVPIRGMDKPFFGSGLEINRILKFNYMNLGYAGFGVGVFTRIGYHAHDTVKENLYLRSYNNINQFIFAIAGVTSLSI